EIEAAQPKFSLSKRLKQQICLTAYHVSSSSGRWFKRFRNDHADAAAKLGRLETTWTGLHRRCIRAREHAGRAGLPGDRSFPVVCTVVVRGDPPLRPRNSDDGAAKTIGQTARLSRKSPFDRSHERRQ